MARPTTTTGSIGVIMSSVNAAELAQKIGLQPVTIASGANKSMLNPLEPVNPEYDTVYAQTRNKGSKMFMICGYSISSKSQYFCWWPDSNQINALYNHNDRSIAGWTDGHVGSVTPQEVRSECMNLVTHWIDSAFTMRNY